MKSTDNFASLMEESMAAGTSRAKRRLKAGEVVEGTVIQISADSVFVDVGTPGDARLPKAEVTDDKGELRVKVGDRLNAVVLDARGEAPLLSAAFGRGAVDLSSLELAKDSGAPISGRVAQVVKGGVEVEVAHLRAFCPASHLDTMHVADLEVFVGQTLEFRVLEIRDRGRSVVLSRRSLLEQQRKELERESLQRLKPGLDVEGVVQGLQRHGALVDVGGVIGFVHVSELAHHRVERVEDVLKLGDRIQVRVLAVEESPKGPRVKLSMKALEQPAAPAAAPSPEEVLAGTVSRVTNFGVFVQTAKGEGLVPVRELGLPPGADHRRAFPAGREIQVVLLSRDAASGKLRFSMVGVAGVEERRNYREFSQAGGGAEAPSSFGSLGDLLRDKLGAAATPATAKPQAPAPVPGQPLRRRR
ncbi:MAG TPA: S1 RNA-binding domain-containing protein [Polyangiaceae bacterium]|nr:S1 RNA-binding domain-containing protein [Polyangiaceae bacterium]